MANPFTAPSLTGYNDDAPPDDGSNVAANEIEWQKHIDEIGDPLKTYSQAIASNITTAFGKIFGAAKNAQSTNYTIQTSDQGKWIAASNTITVTLPDTADTGENFVVGIVNVSDTTISIATTSSQTINGSGTTASLTARGDGMIFMSDGTNWIAYNCLASNDDLPRSYLAGLRISNNGSDAAHDIDIAVGECRDAGNAANLALTSALTKQIDVSWSAGSNDGGFPSGLSLSNDTWYHVFLIRDSATGTVDAGFDTSVTASNLLSDSGYDQYRRIGSVKTDGSANIYAFYQKADLFLWAAAKHDVSNDSIGTTAESLALSVPLGIETEAIIRVIIDDSSGAVGFLVSSPNVNDEAPNILGNAAVNVGGSVGTGNGIFASELRVLTNTSSQVRVRSDTASTNTDITTIGWVDTRGKES